MKKILISLTIIISCLGISRVSADSVEFNYSYNYLTNAGITNFNEFSSYLNKHEGKVLELYRLLFEKYNSDYVNDYPYYLIQFYASNSNIIITLTGLKSPIYLKTPGNVISDTYYEDGTQLENFDNTYIRLVARYSFDDGTYILPVVNNDFELPAHYGLQGDNFNETFFFDSNFDLKIYTDMDNIIIHNYRDTNSDYIINSGDVYPTLYKNGISSTRSYTEINLNDYSYVILTLKNYEVEPFSTTIQVKGQFCSTPVYSLGTESSEETFGTNVKNVCTPYYDTYTPYVINYYSDYLDNFAFLYVKAYDTTKENYIKVDNRLFDISYITEENKDKPLVYYQGNSIPTIPYDDLPSTATQNTQTGYVPDYGNSFSFTDIFKSPLNFLKEVWSTIVTFFSLITSFIALLPPELRGFLFASFTLGIGLGLVKILIGAF